LQGPGFGPQGPGYFSGRLGLTFQQTGLINVDKTYSGTPFVSTNGSQLSNYFFVSNAALSGSDIGIFFILVLNASGGTGFRLANQSGGSYTFLYNSNTGTTMDITGTPGQAFLLVWDGTYFIVF
jgi:hypothetical protein